MASLTIRKLDEAIKQQLRLRAARHGRSVEDEVRAILREAGDEPTGETPPLAQTGQPAANPGVAVSGPRVTLVIGGGIAAYKSLDLIRRLRERGVHVRCVLTEGAQHFVTPLAASTLASERCYTDLFDPQSEFDAGHIRLARDCDLIVVAPATADLIAKMANGLANDLATAMLLAARRPILIAPAMNPAMWDNPATRRNVARLRADGLHIVGPHAGEMAEAGEAGIGRMAEPLDIVAAAMPLITVRAEAPLKGRRVIVTAGPTHEPIDPVRYIANRSSGKQGYAIAAAAARAGADVVLISGPVTLPSPPDVRTIRVESAREMLAQVEKALPTDIAIFCAAVADWRIAQAGTQKIKKTAEGAPALTLTENPDILSTIAHLKHNRPALVIGFAAETENVIDNARAKLKRKGCDWIVANDVSVATGIMGGDRNRIHLIREGDVEDWPELEKEKVAAELIARVATHFDSSSKEQSS